MAPTKTSKVAFSSQPTTSAKKYNIKRTTKGHKPNHEIFSEPTVPGVQKIKALLRQTRRLLAKDKLAADVRVATERKMRALEKELAEAERIRKEKTMASRYHKVKFFERQKVTRKINQAKRQLEACSDKAEKKTLKRALHDLRVDLNYIHHYPKTKKYISLFPPEVRSPTDQEVKGKNKDDGNSGSEYPSDTDAQRETLRRQIREMMERGELSSEPETESNSARTAASLDPYAVGGDLESHENRTLGGSKALSGVDDDAFFGEDSGEEMDDT